MNAPDAINAMFEACGAWSVWANVARLRRDRDVKGVVWQFTVVWWMWGIWNLWFYGPALHQWLSEAAGAVLVCGNLVWLVVWLWILHERRRGI